MFDSQVYSKRYTAVDRLRDKASINLTTSSVQAGAFIAIKEAKRVGYWKRIFTRKKKVIKDPFISAREVLPPGAATIVQTHNATDVSDQCSDAVDTTIAACSATLRTAVDEEHALEIIGRYDVLVDELFENADLSENLRTEFKKKVKRAFRTGEDTGFNKGVQYGITESPTESIGCQTDSAAIATSTDDLEEAIAFTCKIQNETEAFKQVDTEKLIKKMKDSLTVKTCRDLTYYLKCKYAFCVRTPSLLTGMKTDARVWMISKNYEMTTEIEYQTLTSAVLAAFMIDPSEFAIYQLLASREFWNAAYVYNAALAGQVDMKLKGKIFNPRENVRGHARPFLFTETTKVNYKAPNTQP